MAAAGVAHAAADASLVGRVLSEAGDPVGGAFVTLQRGDPIDARSVLSEPDGSYRVPGLVPADDYVVRVRRIGWKDLRLTDQALASGSNTRELRIERETDPAAVAEQLPSNRWFALVLQRLDDPVEREEFVRQCTYCHQQGSAATHRERDPEEWHKVLLLMGRKGGFLSGPLREKLPAILNAAYDPAHAVPQLTQGMDEPGFAPTPPPRVRREIVDEWELGLPASMQHDIVVHPDGTVYSVDMDQDRLYRLDVRGEKPVRRSWKIPSDGLPPGGVFAGERDNAETPTSNSHVGPHSLQVAPDGSLWITLAIGNRLARFDPKTESFEIVKSGEGWYPHTLRFDQRGRIWYTLAASNHVGMYDPATGAHREVRLPADTFAQAVVTRLLPEIMWLNRHVDVRGAASDEGGMNMPVPYGIDVAPDGGVWFSQLNQRRIGRVDPDTFEVETVDTPFGGPRRLRFDSRGRLWIPGFSSGLISRFDLKTHEFVSYPLPIQPAGSDVPYALNVDRRSDTVWICGTNSDTLMRFEPDTATFTVYPLPTRVTYTREIDFDAQGRVWTSNSNSPTWQIEGGFARILRLDPEGLAPGPAVAGSHAERSLP